MAFRHKAVTIRPARKRIHRLRSGALWLTLRTMRRRELLESGACAFAAAAVMRPAMSSTPARAAEVLLRQLGTPQDLATPLRYLDRLITPEPLFFVRSHFGMPVLDRKRRLKVDGPRPLDLGVEDLGKLRQVTVTAVLQCAGNGRALHEPRVPGLQWEHGAMGQATWTGVRLMDLLDKAGVRETNGHVRLEPADIPQAPAVPKLIRSIPLGRAADPTTIVATHMNGQPLTAAHGAPMRLVVPGWTGQHWVKWLRAVRVQKDEAEGTYQRSGYRMPKSPVAPGAAVPPENMVPLTSLLVKSVIARPETGASLGAGPQQVVGVAFSSVAVERVDVSTDGGETWSRAKLQGEPGPGRWQIFRHAFRAAAGRSYRILARATDVAGATQPQKPSWNPSGYVWNGWHAIDVKVKA